MSSTLVETGIIDLDDTRSAGEQLADSLIEADRYPLEIAIEVGETALSGAQEAERKAEDSPVVGGIALRGAFPGQRFGTFVEKLPRGIRGGIDIWNPRRA
ncbi:MAG TPA: hypothetical protein VG604_04430 [Candidatus Saccharimonadales bacterium]|nr:hypothetical protein [Candidatus Saccharimonadales bacterium]